MKQFEAWAGFKGRLWKEEVNTRDFIQNNYTPYDGDEKFLEGPTEATDRLWGKLQELQKELLKKSNNKEAYDEIADDIFQLREQREKCTIDTAARDAQIARINELQDFIKQQPEHLEAFDEALVKRWLERIIVREDHFTVELKSGLKIEIEG